MGEFIQYIHHGKNVWVRESLVGQHREHCLCYKCDHLNNCLVAESHFKFCKQFNVVAPMWECPTFKEAQNG